MTHGNVSQHRRLVKVILAAFVSACLAFGGVPAASLQCAVAYADEPAAQQPTASGKSGEGDGSSAKAGDDATRDAGGNESGDDAAKGGGSGDAGHDPDPGKGKSGPDPAGEPSDDEIDPDKVYGLELYATPTNSDGNWVRPKLDDALGEGGIHWLAGGITEKGGRLKLLVRAAWGTGEAFWQYDEGWRTLSLRYESSDASVAVVSSTGIVTAVGDGDAVFTVTEATRGLKAQLGVHVVGQQGAFVTGAAVCDESGREYGDERVTFKDTDNKLPLYVRESLSDGTTASNAPGAADYAPEKLTPVIWSVSDSDIGSVNANTGVFIPKALGSVKVYATATGGDPNEMGGKVSSFVWVVIDNGEYNLSEDVPSNELTVNVVYDKYPDEVVNSQHYTIDELKAIEEVRCTYTLTRSEGKYVTASGIGIHLLTLIERAGVDIGQVKSFTFTALDGVNPGKMSYDFLFGKRYWWPNYGYNNFSGETSVFPMLAWQSNWRENDAGGEDSHEDFDNLSDGKRLRLLFGSESTADNKTDHSLKYISEMTIRIDGAPDITNGDDDNGDGPGDGGKPDATGPGSDRPSSDGPGGDSPAEDGPGSGDPGSDGPDAPGDDGPGGDGPGEGPGGDDAGDHGPGGDSGGDPAPQTDTEGQGDSGVMQDKPGEAGAEPSPSSPADGEATDPAAGEPEASPGDAADEQPAGQPQGPSSASPQESRTLASASAQQADSRQSDREASRDVKAVESDRKPDQRQVERAEAAPDPTEDLLQAAARRWRVYQMLNPQDDTNFQIEALNDNPLEPFAIALMAAALLVGSASSGIAFRRQTMVWRKA